MRRFITVLIMGGVWLHLSLWAQSDILNKNVTLQYSNLSIREVLYEIQQEYGVKFSYLNNEIPAEKKINLTVTDEPLYKALDKIFNDTPIGYQVVSGQVILKKVPEKKVSEKTDKPANIPAKAGQETPASTKQTSGSKKAVDQNAVATIEKPQPENTASDEITEPVLVESKSINQKPAPAQPIDAKPVEDESPVIIETDKVVAPVNTKPTGEASVQKEQKKTKPGRKPFFERLGLGVSRGLQKGIFDNLPEENDAYERKPFHVGIIYPLSTNGTDAGKYVNEISIHLIGGYAAGLDGFEVSGLGNVESDFVHGAQLAGFFNIVKKDVEGAQFAGFANLNGGYTKGAQFAGFTNVVADSAEGGQFAGFANVNTGRMTGAQFAGFMNVTTNPVNAGQFAGFINYAHGVKGAQMAGFANVAIGDVNGFQGSAFLNVARNVKGVQLAFLNLADSIDGVPIGFLSIVRKNGYRRLEVWGSESLQANIAFKTGVKEFYNIFAFGTQFQGDEFRWAAGYGIGTHLYSGKTFSMNVDLLAHHVWEEGDNFSTENTVQNNGTTKVYHSDLNILSALKLGFNFQLANHLGIFVAPTFNVMVSEVVNTETGEIGSNLPPSWTFYDKTFDNRTNVKMWPGFNAGLRF